MSVAFDHGLDELQAVLCGLQLDADALAERVNDRSDVSAAVRRAVEDVRISLSVAHEIVCDEACKALGGTSRH
ncbi:MAG TPA: hypothetical protein VKS60_06195 [Stellaceae bacterium]|nr:hypothetical protein [Stellaceae bacterium]